MTKLEIQEKLQNKTVGIAGCGGLGSNAAISLARVGLLKFILVDFDRIDAGNLNRQYYFRDQIGEKKVDALADNMHKIDDSIQIKRFDLRLESSDVSKIFAECDLIIEAFDNAFSKMLLVETVMEQLPHIPLIVGNGMAGIGGFDTLKIIKWAENVYVCGDGISEIGEDLPPLGPRVAIVANMQANLALELLVK